MTARVAMLRGVNVGGHNKIRMEDLRKLCKSLKFEDAQTYVQSGNVVFASDETDVATLAKCVEDTIEKKFGFRPAVILRTAGEMRAVVKKNPFAKREFDPAKLAVLFLNADLSAETRKQLETINVGPEEVKAYAREIYAYFPDGMGRSKLSPAIDRIIKKTGTGRNWNSVLKLTEMAEEMEDQFK
jgi:uncharacterized protein (DUF1697 family)